METFHVKNYKGLKDLELTSLSKVNLILQDFVLREAQFGVRLS